MRTRALPFHLSIVITSIILTFQPVRSQNLQSVTDSVIVSTLSSSTDWGRGFRFSPLQDVWVYKIGKRVPSAGSFVWVIWDVATQTKVFQQTSLVDNPGNWEYEDCDSIVKLTSGNQYILELYGAGVGTQYYFGTSSQISSDFTYLDMRYCNSCNTNTYPTSVLSNYHYGTPDFLYSYYPPIYGPNDAAAQSIDSLNGFCAGVHPVYATIRNSGTNQIDTVTINWSVNGIVQTPVLYTQTLDTLNGIGPNTASVLLGNNTFLPNVPYNIEVWTSNPNNVADTVTFNDTIQGTFSSSLSGNFTVNSTQPTGGTNFQTFGDMASAFNSSGICSPVVVDVVPGTGPYNEQVQLGQILGSSAVNTITINGHGNILTYAPNSTNRYVLHLNGTDYLKVDSLNVVSTNATYGYGIALTNDATYDSITNCTVDLSAVTSTTAANSAGIMLNGGISSNATTGPAARYCYFANNYVKGGTNGGPYYGIKLYGSTGQVINNHFVNNRVEDFYVYGIHATYADSNRFTRNSVSRPNKSTISTFGGIYLTTSTTANIIEGNRVHTPISSTGNPANTVYGIYLSTTTGLGSENVVRNNLVYNINSTSTAYGIYIGGAGGTRVYHNTLSIDDANASGTTTTYCIYQSGSTSDIEVRNNVVTLGRGGSGTKYVFYYGSVGSISASTNNVVNITSTSGTNYMGYLNSIAYPNLATWQFGTGYDNQSIETDPQYLNPGAGNFQPINPSVNDIGTNLLTSVPNDINGNARSATPDPGAYEFTIPADDAGIQAMITPDGNYCAGTQPVIVNVANYGLDTLNSATVNWEVNGIVQTPVSLTGLGLPQGADTLVTVGNYNFLAGQTYNVIAWTTNPNGVTDLATYNDTVYALNLQEGMGGNYTIDPGLPPSATNYQTFTDAVNDLHARGLCSSVIFDVATGTYTESLTFNIIPGAGAGTTVTFRSAGGDSMLVTLAHTSNSATNGTVNLTGTDYVAFERITFHNAGTSYNVNVYFSGGADHNRFSNCAFMGDTLSTSSTSSNYSHVYSNLSRDEFNIFENSHFTGNVYAFYLLGGSSTEPEKGNVIRGNMLDRQCYMPIRVQYEDSVTISGNTIDMFSTYTSSTYGIYVANSINACNISENVIIPTGKYPFYSFYLTGLNGGSTEHAVISNNMIANGDTLINDAFYGMYFTSSGNIDVVHNSIHLLTNSDNAAGIYTTATAEIKLYNNIVNMHRKGRSLFISNSYNVDASDHNLLRTGSTILGTYNGFAYNNLAAWQSNTGLDANSISTDPLFQTDTILRTCNAAINGAGTPLTTVNTDIDGDSRNTLTPDIGADEFTGAGVYNLGPDIFKCAYDTVTFGGEVIGGNTYQWNTLQTTPGITTNQAGTYIVNVTSGCGVATDTIVVNNIPLPSATFTSSTSFYTAAFTYTGTGATQWHWDFGDGATDTLEDPYHIYGANGVYNVTLTTYNDCGDSSVFTIQVTINVVNGLEQQENGISLQAYPNPNTGILYLNTPETAEGNARIIIYDAAGKVVREFAGVSLAPHVPYQLDITHVAPGTYILAYIGQETRQHIRFVKQ